MVEKYIKSNICPLPWTSLEVDVNGSASPCCLYKGTIPNYKVNEKSSKSKQPVSKGWFLNAHKAVGITYEIGDDTPRDRIRLIGKKSSISMMKVMIE